MNWLAVVIVGAFLGLMVYAEADLPDRGDPQAPANIRVSPHYIERSLEETQTPNIVTAVLADYRGYDTLGETVVIFTGGLAVILILGAIHPRRHPLRESYQNPVVEGISKWLVPFFQIFALYVITHGHYGPGGGFQGGVVLAASMMLLRLALGEEYEHRRFPPHAATAVSALGLMLFALAGLIPIFRGGEFMNYAHLPIPEAPAAQVRYLGILIAEVGIGFAVWGTLVTLFDRLIGREL